MRRIRLTREEAGAAARWAADSSWLRRKRYMDDPEYLACVQDILESEVINSMDRFIQHGDTTCKAHCIQVSYMSYCICRKYNWDYRGAARAGLLHDLFLYDWHSHAKETGEYFHGFTHPAVALKNADRHFQLTDAERNMILRHMWPLTPVPPRSMAGMSIVYADKFCGLVEVYARAKSWVSWNLRPKHL